MKKVKLLFLGLIALVMSGCVLIDTGSNKESVEILAKAAVAQVVFTGVEKNSEVEPVCKAIIEVLKKLDASVDMTPEEIANYIIKELEPKIKGDWALIINGVVESFFTKYNLGWGDKVPAEDLHRYINDIIDSIQLGLDTYHNKK